MTRIKTRYEKWRDVTYQKWAPGMVAFSLITACCASVGVLWLTKVQGDEQERRSEAISGLQSCFDTYAMQSSATSKAVREASVEVSIATTERDVALDAIFAYIATDPADNDPRGIRLFTDLLGTNAELVASQAELAKVRAENPVPDPPSTFCPIQP